MLIQEDDLDMGNGIEGDIKLSRNGNAVWTAMDDQRMQLTLPLRIVGELGLQRRGLGNFFQSKFPLDEQFNPVILINPEINEDWSISIKDFELQDLGGKMNLDVLGMKLDLTGILTKEIRNWANEYLSDNRELVSLKPLVDVAWAQAGKPFRVDFMDNESAFSIQPREVRLKEFIDEDENMTVWLGLSGKVNSHPADAAPSRAFPLPNLSENSDSTNHLDIIMPFSLSYEKLDEMLSENISGQTFRVNKKTIMTPSNLRTRGFGELMAVEMDFLAEQSNGESLNGTLFVVGRPTFDEQKQALTLSDVNFKLESGNFGAQTSVGLKRRKIIRQIEQRAVFPIGDVLSEGMENIQDRLGLNTPIADLKIVGLEILPDGFYPTNTGLMVHMKASGKVDVDWK